MRDTYDEIYRKQYKTLSTILIPLFLESHDRYYFSILSMITLLHHFYINHEIYYMSHNKKINRLNDGRFIEKMSEWNGFIEFGGKMRKMEL